MTFGSLFSGIAGMDLGLEQAGLQCKWQVEIDEFARKVLAKHWPQVPRFTDIREVTGAKLSPVDLIAGGFPCQDLSQAGKRAGIEGSRSGLWSEFARLIGVLRPRFVLIENVPGLLAPGAMSRVLGDLSRLGYVGLWRCLRASEFGASHLRKRVFIVAYRSGQLGRREPIGLRGSAVSSSVGANRAELADAQHGPIGAELFSAPGGWPDRAAANGSMPGASSPELADDPQSRSRSIPEPAGWDNATDSDSSGSELADSPLGRRRILRQSSGGDGLTDGSHAELGNAEEPDRRRQFQAGGAWIGRAGSSGASEPLADTGIRQLQEPGRDVSAYCRAYSVCFDANHCDGNDCYLKRTGREYPDGFVDFEDLEEFLPNTSIARLQDTESQELCGTRRGIEGGTASELCRAPLPFAPGPADPRWPDILRDYPDLAPALESPLRRVADGTPDWMDGALSDRTKRLSRIGNGVVPQVAEYLGRIILQRANAGQYQPTPGRSEERKYISKSQRSNS